LESPEVKFAVGVLDIYSYLLLANINLGSEAHDAIDRTTNPRFRHKTGQDSASSSCPPCQAPETSQTCGCTAAEGRAD